MKKILACLLALPLALAACGAQTADTAQSAPPAESEQTTETAPETSAPAASTTGRLRSSSYMVYTSTGMYSMNQKYDEATETDTFYIIKTDLNNGVQEKLAEIDLRCGLYYGMAAWDDTVEIYLLENADKDNPPEWRCIIDTSTGDVERLPVNENFFPVWCDDAALYELDYGGGERIIRLDRATNEISYISNLPQQTQMVYGAGDKWLINRIVSPSPLPNQDDGDMYDAVLQNSEKEFDLFDATTGEMQKLYSYPAVGEEYYYIGQHGGILYFQHQGEDGFPAGVDKLENGKMVQVWARNNQYSSQQALKDEQGELQWIVQDNGKTVEIYDLNDEQIYYPIYGVETSTYASTGYPQMLLPGGQVLVTHGSIPDNSFWDEIAYATIDRAAYLAGSTDYTPIEMYKGD